MSDSTWNQAPTRRRVGRPALDPLRKRRPTSIALSRDEAARIDAVRPAGIPLAAFIRQLAVQATSPPERR